MRSRPLDEFFDNFEEFLKEYETEEKLRKKRDLEIINQICIKTSKRIQDAQ